MMSVTMRIRRRTIRRGLARARAAWSAAAAGAKRGDLPVGARQSGVTGHRGPGIGFRVAMVTAEGQPAQTLRLRPMALQAVGPGGR